MCVVGEVRDELCEGGWWMRELLWTTNLVITKCVGHCEGSLGRLTT